MDSKKRLSNHNEKKLKIHIKRNSILEMSDIHSRQDSMKSQNTSDLPQTLKILNMLSEQ